MDQPPVNLAEYQKMMELQRRQDIRVRAAIAAMQSLLCMREERMFNLEGTTGRPIISLIPEMAVNAADALIAELEKEAK